MKPLPLIRGALMVCAITLLCAPAALAAKTSTSFENTPLHLNGNGVTHSTSSSGVGGSVIRTIVGLAIVVAVIYGLSWIIRQSRRSRQEASGVGLAQVASLPLGPNRAVTLVRVGDELHLLGVAEQGITAIRIFNEDEAYDLGIPFDPPEDDRSSVRGSSPIQRAVEAIRRMTTR